MKTQSCKLIFFFYPHIDCRQLGSWYWMGNFYADLPWRSEFLHANFEALANILALMPLWHRITQGS